MAPERCGRRQRAVHEADGGESVQCVVIATGTSESVVLNRAYPDALAHAEGHLAEGAEGVWICGPDCSGA